jgi:hypothetical protein
MPWPSSVEQGQGICRVCAGRGWDIVYVVADVGTGRVKVGVTSGDPRPRLKDHRRRGYTTVVRTVEREDAQAVERAVLAALAAALYRPVKGREYFDISALDLICAVVDSHLQAPGNGSDHPLLDLHRAQMTATHNDRTTPITVPAVVPKPQTQATSNPVSNNRRTEPDRDQSYSAVGPQVSKITRERQP